MDTALGGGPLTQLSSLVGRTDEPVEPARLLDGVRLLTLTGPAGVGSQLLLASALAAVETADGRGTPTTTPHSAAPTRRWNWSTAGTAWNRPPGCVRHATPSSTCGTSRPPLSPVSRGLSASSPDQLGACSRTSWSPPPRRARHG